MFDHGFFQIEDLSYADILFQKIVDEYKKVPEPKGRLRLTIHLPQWYTLTEEQKRKLNAIFEDIHIE